MKILDAPTHETVSLALAMTDNRSTPFDHREAIAHITKDDPRLAALIEKSIEFKLNIDEEQSPYESLLRAIAYQSIAGKAAAVIFGRIKALGTNGRCPTPEELLRVPHADAPRSRPFRRKNRRRSRPRAKNNRRRRPHARRKPRKKCPTQELVERLISVRGIGAWTVEMFLIFRLGRPDVLPIHDYGVQKGFALTYRKRRIPKPKELAKFGERWRPWRTVASWYMWRAIDVAGKDARKIGKKSGATKKRKALKKRIVVKKRAAAKKRVVVKK